FDLDLELLAVDDDFGLMRFDDVVVRYDQAEGRHNHATAGLDLDPRKIDHLFLAHAVVTAGQDADIADHADVNGTGGGIVLGGRVGGKAGDKREREEGPGAH